MEANIDAKILGAVQRGIPVCECPFEQIAQAAGISVNSLLQTLEQWKQQGKMRRIGAIVNHFKAGHGTGAMVVWRVPEDQVEQAGRCFSAFDEVSHVYLRTANEQWPYNLYTMVHGPDLDQLEKSIVTMSVRSGMGNYRVLKTVRELKKSSPVYVDQ